MLRAIRVLVTGASELAEEYLGFAQELGQQLMKETPFVLVTGGLAAKKGSSRTALDKVVAESAFNALGRSVEAAQSRIITILPESDHPKLERFEIGSVVRMSYCDSRTRRYSMVLTSDAIVAVNGANATREILDLAYVAGKPMIALSATGGTALDIWRKYETDLVRRLRLDAADVLGLSDAGNPSRVASTCLGVLARVLRPRCFLAMPFSGHPLALTFETIRAVAEDLGFQVIRIDQESFVGNIVEAIWDAIRHSDVVIADLTNHKPNVYYEMGISHALGKPTLLTVFSRDGNVPEDIPFDVKIQRIIPYGTTQSLQIQLRELLPTSMRWPGNGRLANSPIQPM